MANTVTLGAKWMTIVPDGATAFDMADYFPAGMRLTGIYFRPSAQNDILVVREGSATGAKLIHKRDSVGDGFEVNFTQPYKCSPYLHVADQTWNSAANVVITFEFA